MQFRFSRGTKFLRVSPAKGRTRGGHVFPECGGKTQVEEEGKRKKEERWRATELKINRIRENSRLSNSRENPFFPLTNAFIHFFLLIEITLEWNREISMLKVGRFE